MSYYNLEDLEVYQLAIDKLQTIHLKLNAYLKFIGKSNQDGKS